MVLVNGNRDPVASQRHSALLAMRSRSGHQDGPGAQGTRDRIRKMSIANPWGAPASTASCSSSVSVSCHRRQAYGDPQSLPDLRSFLRNHGRPVAVDIRCCDRDFGCSHRDDRPRHDRRRIIHFDVTQNPAVWLASNNRGLPMGYGTSVPAARSGSVIWPGFPRSHLYDGYQGGCYCGALAVAERLRRTHHWFGPP